jgi:hypothetical protein
MQGFGYPGQRGHTLTLRRKIREISVFQKDMVRSSRMRSRSIATSTRPQPHQKREDVQDTENGI